MEEPESESNKPPNLSLGEKKKPIEEAPEKDPSIHEEGEKGNVVVPCEGSVAMLAGDVVMEEGGEGGDSIEQVREEGGGAGDLLVPSMEESEQAAESNNQMEKEELKLSGEEEEKAPLVQPVEETAQEVEEETASVVKNNEEEKVLQSVEPKVAEVGEEKAPQVQPTEKSDLEVKDKEDPLGSEERREICRSNEEMGPPSREEENWSEKIEAEKQEEEKEVLPFALVEVALESPDDIVVSKSEKMAVADAVDSKVAMDGAVDSKVKVDNAVDLKVTMNDAVDSMVAVDDIVCAKMEVDDAVASKVAMDDAVGAKMEVDDAVYTKVKMEVDDAVDKKMEVGGKMVVDANILVDNAEFAAKNGSKCRKVVSIKAPDDVQVEEEAEAMEVDMDRPAKAAGKRSGKIQKKVPRKDRAVVMVGEGVETKVDSAEPTKASGSSVTRWGKKRGRPRKSEGGRMKGPPKLKEDEESLCFICFDGGDLVVCDHRGCPKVYHPSCVNRDDAYFQAKGRWNCGMLCLNVV